MFVTIAMVHSLSDRAQAQGIPVLDQSVITQAIHNVNALTQQIQQMTMVVNHLQSLNKTIGQEGLSPWLTHPNSSGYVPYEELSFFMQRGMNQAKILESHQQEFVKSLSHQTNDTGSNSVDFSNFSNAQQWVVDTFQAQNNNLTTLDQVRKKRTALATYSSSEAYSLALTIEKNAQSHVSRHQNLIQQASQASDMRSDIEANTAVIFAIQDEMTEIKELLSALLKVEASSKMSTLDPSISSTSLTKTPSSPSSSQSFFSIP